MKRELKLFYKDIYDSICLIERYIGKKDYSSFRRDIKLVDSVIRRIEIIGEAVTHIPKRIRGEHPNVLWDSYIDSRNFLIHVYFGANYLRVWGFVKNRLPILKNTMGGLLKNGKN